MANTVWKGGPPTPGLYASFDKTHGIGTPNGAPDAVEVLRQRFTKVKGANGGSDIGELVILWRWVSDDHEDGVKETPVAHMIDWLNRVGFDRLTENDT